MFDLREILTTADRQQAQELLQSQGLNLPEAVEYGVGAYSNDTLVATGFLGEERLMGLCVEPDWRGEGLSLTVVNHLLQQALATGHEHLFIFTKGTEAHTFASMGFTVLVVAPSATGATALLEWGRPNLSAWLARVPQPYPPLEAIVRPFAIGAVVLNANPFTLGHAYLLEQAAAQCHSLYAFVVQEDRSIFPFDVRLQLVREGMAHVSHCHVLSGGPYMISRHTFPSYFTGEAGRAAAHAALDAHLFAQRLAPDLGIEARFIGTEPLSPVTAAYNAALHSVLPQFGLKVREVPRIIQQEEIISASRVRAHLAHQETDKALALVPPCTAQFLESPAGQAIVCKLQQL